MSSDSGSGWGSDGSGERGGFKLKHKDKKDKKDKPKDKDKKDKDKKEKKGGDKDKKDKDKKDKDKKDKDKKDKKDEHSGSHSGYGGGAHLGMGAGAASEFLAPSGHGDFRSHSDAGGYPGAPPPYPPPHSQSPGSQHAPVDFKSPSQFGGGPPPPPPHQSTMSSNSQTPPSGYRVPLRTDSAFPPPDQCGPPLMYDADGISPIFIGSALFESSVQPCKIGPHLQPTPVALAYGGREVNHNGRYDLLPFVPDQMEWVPAQYGQIPPGRRPVEGGYEDNGGKLYHALANVNGVRVPGKTGEHLGAANVPFGGEELVYQQYEILCWRY